MRTVLIVPSVSCSLRLRHCAPFFAFNLPSYRRAAPASNLQPAGGPPPSARRFVASNLKRSDPPTYRRTAQALAPRGALPQTSHAQKAPCLQSRRATPAAPTQNLPSDRVGFAMRPGAWHGFGGKGAAWSQKPPELFNYQAISRQA